MKLVKDTDQLKKKSQQISDERAEEAIKTIIQWIGENPNREGLKSTPKRVLKAYREYFNGYTQDPKIFLSICYLIFILCYLIMGISLELNNYFYIGILIVILHLLFFQIYNFKKEDKLKCLNIFKSNNFLGLIVLTNILIGKI